MAKFVFSVIGALLLIAVVFTLIQYLAIILLKRKEEVNTEKPKEK